MKPSSGSSPDGPQDRREAGATRTDLPALPPMGTMVGYKLRRAQLFVFHDFIKTFSRMKLRPAEFSVLALIAANPGQKQTAVAEQLGIKRANFVALMDGLEARGLAERRKAETDRRSHSLHLTREGRLFVEKMTAVWQEHEGRMVDRLGGPEDRDRLIALLDRLVGPDEPSGG